MSPDRADREVDAVVGRYDTGHVEDVRYERERLEDIGRGDFGDGELATGHVVACHWAEDIKAGKIEPKEVAPVFERGPALAAAYEPPPT